MNVAAAAAPPAAPPPQRQLPASESAGMSLGDRQFLSADGRHFLVSSRRADDTETEKYTLVVYDRQSKARVGAFRSSVAVLPFFVTDSKVVCEVGASVERVAGGALVEHPRRIRAIDLVTGKEVWSQAVRDTTNRGPFPP